MPWARLGQVSLLEGQPRDDDDVVRCFIEVFITQGGEGRGDTSKESKATKSEGRGLEEGASRGAHPLSVKGNRPRFWTVADG